jgi:hypothetical protein
MSPIADAIRDCSRRGEVVLDCFVGSGSTLIAAEMTGRSAWLIEYNPLYCDTLSRPGRMAVACRLKPKYKAKLRPSETSCN